MEKWEEWIEVRNLEAGKIRKNITIFRSMYTFIKYSMI